MEKKEFEISEKWTFSNGSMDIMKGRSTSPLIERVCVPSSIQTTIIVIASLSKPNNSFKLTIVWSLQS